MKEAHPLVFGTSVANKFISGNAVLDRNILSSFLFHLFEPIEIRLDSDLRKFDVHRLRFGYYDAP